MTLDSALRRAGLSLIIDSRVKFRKGEIPSRIRVRYIDEVDTMQAITVAPSLQPSPLVLVLASGQVFVIAREGKGGIAVQGEEGALSEEQVVALETVKAVMVQHFGMQAEEPVKPKRKMKPKASPDAPGADVRDANIAEVAQEPADVLSASEGDTAVAVEEPSDG